MSAGRCLVHAPRKRNCLSWSDRRGNQRTAGTACSWEIPR
jgi:hypothetical protein